MSHPFNRPTTEPLAAMKCERCDVTFVGAEWHNFCATCVKILDGELSPAVRPGKSVSLSNGERQ